MKFIANETFIKQTTKPLIQRNVIPSACLYRETMVLCTKFNYFFLSFTGKISRYFSKSKFGFKILYTWPLEEQLMSLDHIWRNWSFNLSFTVAVNHFILTKLWFCQTYCSPHMFKILGIQLSMGYYNHY